MKRTWFRSLIVAVLSLGGTAASALPAQWAVPAGYPGTASKVVTDAQGNVYVTGSTYSAVPGDTDPAGSTADMLTVKYDANGVKQWEVTYNGPEGGVDAGTTLVVDGAGNVVVGGYSYFSNWQPWYGAVRAVVVKYSPAGTQLWAVRYPDSDYRSSVASVDVDPAGNVYAALGTVYDSISGNAIDVMLLKYDGGSGAQVWKRYLAYPGPLGYTDDWPSKLMVKGGFVYVSGTFGGGTHGYENNYRDSAVWKFSLDGELAHLYAYDGGSADYAADFTVDGQGNVYVVSMSNRLLTATTQWDAWAYDYATAKFDAAGVLLWFNRYNNQGVGDHRPSSIAVNAAGEVFVTGTSWGDGDNDIATIKYTATGAQDWVDRYSGTAVGDDAGGSVLIGKSGDVFVTGTTLDAGTGLDFTAIKYGSATGARQWVSVYGTAAGVEETVNSAALDPKDGIVLAGSSATAGADPQFLTAKFIEVLDVPVDIRPGFFPNTVSPGSSGQIPVAVLSFPSFEATTVDAASVRFGANGLTVAARSFSFLDVNNDGRDDLVLQFPIQGSGIVCNTTKADLTGSTRPGQSFRGSDSIVTTGCK